MTLGANHRNLSTRGAAARANETPTFDPPFAVKNRPYRRRVGEVFLHKDTGAQRLGSVVAHDRNCPLNDDGAVVQLRGDQVNRDTSDPYAMFQCLTLRIDARKRRQQRWVDVQNRVGKSVQQRRPNQSHVTRQTHQADVSRT